MKESLKDLFETIMKAVVPRIEFPYYALVKVETRRYPTIYLPAPFFTENGNRADFASKLPISSEKRDWEYFQCPNCGEPSFFDGFCDECEWTTTSREFSWDYANYLAMRLSVTREFMYRVDHRLPLTGFRAEMVLPKEAEPDMNEYTGISELYYRGNRRAFKAVEEIANRLNHFVTGELPDDEIIKAFEGELIMVEGTDEIRRYQNGRWFHKHDKQDYWHPMNRVHKG